MKKNKIFHIFILFIFTGSTSRSQTVDLSPDTLRFELAKGKKDGKVVCTKEIVTAGQPAKIQLLADRKAIEADEQDVVHIEVNIQDKENNFVPDASNRIHFKVEGEAKIIAVDNGDPLNDESYDYPSRKAFNGKCLIILKSTGKVGQFKVIAEADGLESADVTVNTK